MQVIAEAPGFSVRKNGAKYFIDWKTTPINHDVFRAIVAMVNASTDYSAPTPGKLTRWQEILTDLNEKYTASTDITQFISIRNIVLKAKIIKGYHRMRKLISKIAGEYEAGGDILELSHKYDFPPLNLLRGILLLRIPANKLYDVFSGKTTPSVILSGRDLIQFKSAEIHDAESVFNQQMITEIAAHNENQVVEYFRKLGIKLSTQEELTIEQTESQGRAVATPDILFLDEVHINGVGTHWIDYKDYTGTGVRFLYNSNAEQAARYVAKWGSGAFCYHKSFVDGVSFPKTILLDGRTLPITYR